MAALSVAIVGAGPAGLTAAAFCARLGLEVTLYGPAPRTVQRGGVILHHNGQRALEGLGLAEAVVRQGHPVGRLDLCLLGDHELASVDFADLDPSVRRPVAVARDVVFTALEAHVAELGVAQQRGDRVTGLWLDQGRAHVQTESGGDDAFDVVLACDGSVSTVREAMAMPGRVGPVRDAWLRGMLSPTEGDGPAVIRENWGPHNTRFCSLTIPGDAGFFWCTVPVGEWERIRAERFDAWLETWAPLGAEVAAALSRVVDWEAVDYREVTEVDLRRWYEAPVFAVGDAAHAFGPFLGQGLNAAMVDACVLSQLLARGRQVSASLEDIGRTWENVRRPVISRLQSLSRQLSVVAGITSAPAVALRDLLIPVASKLDLVGGELLALGSGHHPIEDDYFVIDDSAIGG